MSSFEAHPHAPEIEGNTTPEVKRKAARTTTAGTPAGTAPRGATPPRATDVTPELARRIEAPTPLAPRPAQPTTTTVARRSTVEATRRAWLQALETYEDGVLTFADYEDRLADRAALPLVAQAVRAQAELRRRTLRATTRPARVLLDR